MSDVTDTYYAGEAIHGYGTQLLVGQNEPTAETFVAIADVTTITPGDMTTAVIEKTHLRSPEAHREKMAGLRDSGPFALTGNWRPAHGTHSNAGGDGAAVGLVGLWRQRVERNWKIVLPSVPATGAPVAITSNAAGAASPVTTAAPHGLTSGDGVLITGGTGSVPPIAGAWVVTVTSPTVFTIPLTVTTPGTGGSLTKTAEAGLEWPFRGIVTKFQPGEIGIDEKIPFNAEITPVKDFSADLP